MSTKERRLCFYHTHSILDPSYPPVSALAIEGTVECDLWTRGCQSQRLEAETSPRCQISNMIQSPSVCSEIMRWMKFILQLALAKVRCECEWSKEQKQGEGAWSARKVTAQQRNEPRKEHRKEDTSIHEKPKVEKLDMAGDTLDLMTPFLIPSASSTSRPKGRHRRQEGK